MGVLLTESLHNIRPDPNHEKIEVKTHSALAMIIPTVGSWRFTIYFTEGWMSGNTLPNLILGKVKWRYCFTSES